MLTRVSVENFKSLKHVDIMLKPLTVLIGPNGSGKSSILHSLLVLKKLYATQGNIVRDSLFQLDGYLDMGSWDDVVFDDSMPMRVSMEVVEDSVRMLLNTTISRDGRVSLSVKLRVEEGESLLEKVLTLPYSQKQSQSVTVKLRGGALTINWDGFNAHPASVIGSVDEELKNAIISTLTSWHHRVLFVPCAHSMFRSPQVTVGASKDSILAAIRTSLVVDEQYLASLISLDHNIEEYVWDLAEDIFGVRVRSHVYPPNTAKIIASRKPRRGRAVAIVNEGGGVNRAVYLFTILALAERGSTILVEEPETNLHPKAQHDLARVFADAVTREGRQFIITTHSEHLLLGILDQVRRKKLNLDDLAIYYLERDEEGKSVARQLEVDDRGRVKGGLPGFFEEEVEELVELLSIQ